MSTKKYALTSETVTISGATLHRIQALRDFAGVKKGSYGGFIEKESNLHHYGNSWIFNDAKVFGNACVCDVLFLETLARARGYSYTVPLLVNGASEMIFLHKESGSYESQEYEIWQGGTHTWTVEVGSPIKYVSFLPGHLCIAHVRCRGGEGLIDVERRETLLPAIYRKLSMDEIDFMYAVTHDGVRCLYDLGERKWAVPPGDQWIRSEKGKGCRVFLGETKRRAVFWYGLGKLLLE
jgi:hypothetical protein